LLRSQRQQYGEETRRQQEQKIKAAEMDSKAVFDPLTHKPSVHVQKLQTVQKAKSPESLAAARLRSESDARFYKEKILDLAVQSRSWMCHAATVEKAIDSAFSSPPTGFPASVLYSRAVRFNEKHKLIRSRKETAAVATHDSNILSKDAFDADGAGRA
jgi:hypothetical protein